MTTDDRSGSERRILPRLAVTHEVFRHSTTGRFFAVADLTVKGMAIRVVDREDFFHFPVGGEIEGTLNLRREKFGITGCVRHLGKELIGIEFGDLPSSVSYALSTYLDPVTLGQELRPVPTGDASFLYASTSGTEISFNRAADGRYTRIVVMMLGTLVQWDEQTGLRTGMIQNSFEDSMVTGITRLETMIFSEDRAIDPQKLNLAKVLISSSNLPDDLKKFSSRRLEGASA